MTFWITMCVLDVVVFDCPICTVAISSPEAIHRVLVVDLGGQQALQLIPLNWGQCTSALVWCGVRCWPCAERVETGVGGDTSAPSCEHRGLDSSEIAVLAS